MNIENALSLLALVARIVVVVARELSGVGTVKRAVAKRKSKGLPPGTE